MLKNIIGDQANDVLKTFTYNADQVKLSQMYALMDKYVEPKKNAIHVTVLHNVTNKYQQAYVSAIAP